MRSREYEGRHRRMIPSVRWPDRAAGVDASEVFVGLWLILAFAVASQAVMLGAILIVSGPTVVGPILRAAAPGRRLEVILTHEGTTIDPIGAPLPQIGCGLS